jgi:hypothetical protein
MPSFLEARNGLICGHEKPFSFAWERKTKPNQDQLAMKIPFHVLVKEVTTLCG